MSIQLNDQFMTRNINHNIYLLDVLPVYIKINNILFIFIN
jgi:hypothetical protein